MPYDIYYPGLEVTSAGNVGLGTTTPGGVLDLEHLGTPMAPPGTVSSSGTTVTGSGTTTFTTTFAVGDTIVSSGQYTTVTAIASNTSLTTAAAFSPGAFIRRFFPRGARFRMPGPSASVSRRRPRR